MKASEVLRGAAAVIRTRGWFQGALGDDDGPVDAARTCSVCVVGAMRISASGNPSPCRPVGESPAYWDARAELDVTVGVVDKDTRVPWWNDEPGRTVDEVLAALESTATRLEGEGR